MRGTKQLDEIIFNGKDRSENITRFLETISAILFFHALTKTKIIVMIIIIIYFRIKSNCIMFIFKQIKVTKKWQENIFIKREISMQFQLIHYLK